MDVTLCGVHINTQALLYLWQGKNNNMIWCLYKMHTPTFSLTLHLYSVLSIVASRWRLWTNGWVKWHLGGHTPCSLSSFLYLYRGSLLSSSTSTRSMEFCDFWKGIIFTIVQIIPCSLSWTWQSKHKSALCRRRIWTHVLNTRSSEKYFLIF